MLRRCGNIRYLPSPEKARDFHAVWLMNSARTQPPIAEGEQQLHQTRDAFDSVASDYDGDRGNNALIQDMREEMWRWLDATFVPGSRLLDLGCGTGLDAARMARLGHRITAIDWSPAMVRRTHERAGLERVGERVSALHIGAHELSRLEGVGEFDGAYSNLGALNCVPDLQVVSRECARLLRPGGTLVFTVIGRVCPWELGYYLLRGRWARARVRYRRGAVPVSMNQRTVWTAYYSPREFYRAFRSQFTLVQHRGVCLFAPPPYLSSVRAKHPRLLRSRAEQPRADQ
jgi:SAM-dependent methyltransferase